MNIENEILFRERHGILDDITERKLTQFRTFRSSSFQFKEIKKKRPKLEKGDIFIANLFSDVYFYGVALNANINNESLGDKLICVALLNKYTRKIDDEINFEKITCNDILTEPALITSEYWRNGYFFNVGKIDANDIEVNYKFENYDEYGNICNEKKDIISFEGLTTEWGISSRLMRELIIDPSFMKDEDIKAFEEYFEQLVNYTPPEVELSEFDKRIAPFQFAMVHKRRYEVILDEFDEYKDIFEKRSEELEGNGYDWEDLIKYYIKTNYPDERKKIHFDSEAGMFYMYSSNEELLKSIVTGLKQELELNRFGSYVMEAKFSDL